MFAPVLMQTTSPTRLALALTTSGILLTATAAGPWSFSASALLWAAPTLVAVRCLPALLSWPLVVGVGFLGRVLAWGGALSDSDLIALPLAASVALVPALLVDRLVFDRMPRASLIAWPLGLLATVRVLDVVAPRVSSLVFQTPSIEELGRLEAVAGRGSVVIAVALVAQALGALGTVLNRPTDVVTARERETGVRWGALVGLSVCAAILLAAFVGVAEASP